MDSCSFFCLLDLLLKIFNIIPSSSLIAVLSNVIMRMTRGAVSWFDSHIYGFLTLHNQSSWFIKDPLSHLSPPLLSCWDPWWWSGCCNQPFAISKSMVADWEVQWENERFHRTSPALLFCRYLEKIDLAEDWRSTSFRRLALSDDFHLGSFFCS